MGLGKVLREFGVSLNLDFDKKKLEEATAAIEKVRSSMSHIGLEVAAAAGTIFGFTAATSHNSRELQQNSQMLGINVERLEELEYAARVAAGATRGDLMGALEAMSGTLDRARHSDVMAAQSMQALGVPLDMIMNKSVTADQVLLVLADRFSKIQDPMAKMRLATEVGGAGLAKMLPLLNKGAMGVAMLGKEGRDMGIIMGKNLVDQGAEFDRTLTRIWFVLRNVTYLIGNSLIKYLTPTVLAFQKWAVANRNFLASGIANVVKALGIYLALVFKGVRAVTAGMQGLISSLGGVERVARYVAMALAIFTGFRLVLGIGKVAMAIGTMATALMGVSAPALAIGAALAAIILIVQDWFSKDSTIKRWLSIFKKEFPEATSMISGAFDVVKESVGFISEEIKDLIDVLKDLWKWATNVGSAFGDWLGVRKTIADIKGVANDFMSATGEKLHGAAAWIHGKAEASSRDRQMAEAKAQFIGPRLPGGATTADEFVKGAAGGGAKNEFNANITVNVPAGTSASQAVDMVAGGNQKANDAMLRQLLARSSGQRAY